MSIENIPFRTRARTIDHLGREQIADCPTAVSELWKNAYDAYARHVELDIFDGDVPVAAVVDDGHGMTREEFIEKWLVVGTESKIAADISSEDERGGLPVRPRQGQKGIGRLSCANLGSLLLLVSKQRHSPFAAALIDWRIFENPFLMLQDIRIPVVEFDEKLQLSSYLTQMFDTLMGNIWGSGKDEDKERDQRILNAWNAFDDLEEHEQKASTKNAIENTIINSSFDDRHFSCWSVWRGEAMHGTALFIANISDDLLAQLSIEPKANQEDAVNRAQERLFQTLSNFTDPFAREDEDEICKTFSTSVVAWNGLLRRPIIDEERRFQIQNFYDLEHVVDGLVDNEGIFRGSLKVFGKWLESEVILKPSELYKARTDTACGPFHIRIGTFERDSKKSTYPADVHAFFVDQSEKYSGFMVHRDGLRVMPYGREDNDYFEIEKRRSEHAGRNFWSNRNLFGRVSITRSSNPNLKDKAGREGLIDNKASKRFRYLVENILIETAKKYFGTDSDMRKAALPDIQAQRAQEKAENDRKKFLAGQRKQLRKKLANNTEPLDHFLSTVEELLHKIAGSEEQDLGTLTGLKDQATNLTDKAKDFSLSPVPPNLGSMDDIYRNYRQKEKRAHALLAQANASLNIAIERLAPRAPKEIALNQLQRAAGQLHARIRKWATEGRTLLSDETEKLNHLLEERNKSFHDATLPIVADVERGRIELGKALHLIDEEYQRQYQENNELFSPYISALRSISEQIDLENVIAHAEHESTKLREEVERLHALAQLGITVEIVGHEIEALDMTISRGLKSMPNEIKSSEVYRSIISAQQALSDRWRFLSPLKLSGERIRSDITGSDIFRYVQNFFGDAFQRSEIKFEASNEFCRFAVYEQPARIFPVFINLVNNARYWVSQIDSKQKHILLDVVNERIVVADNGPGVDEEDVNQLFTLFFTRKSRGGRGIGLYLCRMNLLAGGHSIHYETHEENKRLSGANFVIGFKGAKHG